MGIQNVSKQTNHLIRRDGIWYYRRRVPQALQAAFGKKEIQLSLGTPDLAEAKKRRAVEDLKFSARFGCAANCTAGVAQASDQAAPTHVGSAQPSDDEVTRLVQEYVADADKRAQRRLVLDPPDSAAQREQMTDDIEFGMGILTVTVPIGTFSSEYISDQARRGIPQGSALSPLIGAMSVATLEKPSGIDMFNWVDDFLLLGSTQEQAAAAAAALIANVAAIPGGHFSLKLKEVRHAQDTITFLGHSLALEGDKVFIEPAYPDDFWAELEKLDTRIWRLLWKTPSLPCQIDQARILAGDMWVFAISWTEAFKACDNVAEFLETALDQMVPVCSALNLTFGDLQNYSNPGAKWKDRYSSYN
jgi:hypothetical protein